MNPVDPDGHVIADMLSQADFAHSQPSIPTFPVQNNLNPRIGVGRTGRVSLNNMIHFNS